MSYLLLSRLYKIGNCFRSIPFIRFINKRLMDITILLIVFMSLYPNLNIHVHVAFHSLNFNILLNFIHLCQVLALPEVPTYFTTKSLRIVFNVLLVNLFTLLLDVIWKMRWCVCGWFHETFSHEAIFIPLYQVLIDETEC